jgi:addiction module RelE/StbE family toxin
VRVVWSEPAKRDLISARAWIAQDRPRAAASQVAKIVQAGIGLRDFPQKGRQGRTGGARELIVPSGPFIIAYKVRDGMIEILRVMHGSRGWPDGL